VLAATGTPTAVLIASATPTSPATPVSSLSTAPVPTATSVVACVGDCDRGGAVTINELIILVNVALGSALSSACPHGVPGGAEVNIALLIQAVNHALNGCGMT